MCITGADISATDKEGRTPLELADEEGHKAVVDVLNHK